MAYILLNGDFHPANNAVLSIENRGFRYGDGLFETMRYHRGQTLFLKDHYQRLLRAMVALKMNTLSLPAEEDIARMIDSLVGKNRIYKDARIRLSLFRNTGGLYTPTDNRASIAIEATPLAEDGYTLNKKGLQLGLFDQLKKQVSFLSHFKHANALLFVLAAIYKNEQHLDDCLIVNEHGKIIEGLASNLFWISHGIIHTPYLSSGCVDGIMRKQVMKMMRKEGFHLEEVTGTTLNDLLAADEVFLTNAIQGIQWVVGLEEKRYYNNLTKKLYHVLLTL